MNYKLSSGVNVQNRGKHFAAKLTALVLCAGLFPGVPGISVSAEAAENAVTADDPHRLVDLYCSQSAKDALGYDQLEELVDLVITSVEPQAVNLLIESFPCFEEAAAEDSLGKEIGLYIYYKEGDQDGIEDHEIVAPGAIAYVDYGYTLEEDKSGFQYMICIDADALMPDDDSDHTVLDLDGQARIQLDTTLCHELFHAFMTDYNRTGMTGYIDFRSFYYLPVEEISEEEGEKLLKNTVLPVWLQEGLAGCVGHIYPADLDLFKEYRYDIDTQEYLDKCTNDQLCRMYSNMGYKEGTGECVFDLKSAEENNDDGHVNGSVYVSGYMACLYLADLECRSLEGQGAVTFDRNGDIESISSEKLREGISAILYSLHQGDTLDEIIAGISDGAYLDTADFTERFIKGTYNQETQEYNGDPESLSFCVGFINYMNRLDEMDPETHPAGSMLMDDFVSTQPTPLKKDAAASSDFYRIIEKNVLTDSTIPSDLLKDGGTSYSARDSLETVVEMFNAKETDD